MNSITVPRKSYQQILTQQISEGLKELKRPLNCIAGSFEVLTAIFAGYPVTVFDFLLWATIGNIIGGVFFVALLKYSHAIRSKDSILNEGRN